MEVDEDAFVKDGVADVGAAWNDAIFFSTGSGFGDKPAIRERCAGFASGFAGTSDGNDRPRPFVGLR